MVSFLSSRRCVPWQCCSARGALLSPGSPSQAPGHTGEHKEHKATALVLASIVPQCWCWEPTRGCRPWVASGRCCRALLAAGRGRGTERGAGLGAFGCRGALAGHSTHRTVSPGPQPCSWHVSAGQLEPWGRAGCSSHRGRLLCPGLSQRARGWGGACCCRKWGCIQPRKSLKWHFWKGGGLQVPACCTVVPPRLPVARHAGGCSASWGRDPEPPYPNTLGPGSQQACRRECGFDVSHPAGWQPQPRVRTGSLQQEP